MAHNKERLLLLLKELMDNTDELHEYTIKDLISLYEKNGLSADPRTIRDDIAKLQEAGFDVVDTPRRGKPTVYCYSRTFSNEEVQMIIDAVSAAKSISSGQGTSLVLRLLKLKNKNAGPAPYTPETEVSGHEKIPNRNLLVTIQMITQAIRQGKKISYQYYDYGLDKKRILHNDGELYIYSPYGFAWDEDRYYLLGQVDKRPGIINPVRTDLLANVQVLEEAAVPAPKDFSVRKYSDKVFKMFGGEESEVTLEADNRLMKKFIDRFGDAFTVKPASETTFCATVTVPVSPTFFSWVFQYNGRVRITAPEKVRAEYAGMLRRLLAYYE